MARLEDLPPATAQRLRDLECPTFAATPFVAGPPLARRKVAVVTSAALHPRGDSPFRPGSAEVRLLPATLGAGDLVMSHVSINYDRGGFQRDLDTVYPLRRLADMASAGTIGGLAETHYSVMGSTDPKAMEETADRIAGQCRQEAVDAALLVPV
ncbi:MAG: selenoprotein B glycine/betaine/sarcosine/D-proline reductase [Alphaproteobacteria bacterium]|nr:selenoprotein B glycine/betaine/sarcosine/D-proline reductase [Alphaproteobacteria bacterium]